RKIPPVERPDPLQHSTSELVQTGQQRQNLGTELLIRQPRDVDAVERRQPGLHLTHRRTIPRTHVPIVTPPTDNRTDVFGVSPHVPLWTFTAPVQAAVTVTPPESRESCSSTVATVAVVGISKTTFASTEL